MSDAPPRIRPSVEADGPALAEIYAGEVLYGFATFELEPPDAEEMRRRRAALVGDGFPHLVAELDGVVAGFAYAGAYRPRPAYRYAVEDSVYVADWARRRGVGRALLEALIAACTALGRRQMVAVIGDSGHASSIGLHEACGFRHVGVLRDVGYKRARWVDVVLMQRALGEGGATAPPDEP